MTEPSYTHADRLHLVELATKQHAKARAALDAAEATRDEMIRQAFAAKVPAEDIAAAADLHVKRIYQIRRAGNPTIGDQLAAAGREAAEALRRGPLGSAPTAD